jgi:Carbohydrate binding domain
MHFAYSLPLFFVVLGCKYGGSQKNTTSTTSSTDIAIGGGVESGMKRLGMNIDGQSFYDSGQMLRNLTFRNPGFEGETWQTILNCGAVTASSCTDVDNFSTWPANFAQGGTFEFIYGAAAGQSGTITSSTAAVQSANQGVTINFAALSKPPAVGDFVIMKKTIPGDAGAGWWPTTSGGATVTTDTTDISPNSPGKQALQINATGSGQSASLDSYFDSSSGRDFILLNGTYRISFRAKGLGGNNQVEVTLARLSGNGNYFDQTVTLTNSWQDYSFDFSAAETASTVPISNVDLGFAVAGAQVLLDDVSLTPATTSSSNPTPFRDEVVSALTALHPGSLRYMDSGGPTFGSSIDNMITPPFARQRSGWSLQTTSQTDVPLGLHEFLQLCQTVGAEPWYTMPPGMSITEMQNLLQYLGGDASTPYGAKRSALGQASPWTTVFPVIHLELGNEQWNSGTFPGAAISTPQAYGNRVTTIFGAAKSSPYYNPASFDLVMGTQAVQPDLTTQQAAAGSNFDSFAAAPYLFSSLNDTSSNEAIFGPMFAQPESIDSVSTGYMYQQAQAAKAAGKNMNVYEVQLSTLSGSASQSMVNAVVPSVAAGITVADHMLLMMRDLGIKTQNIWALPQYEFQFNGGPETTPLWGTVIDMGGPTNLRRPVFLAAQLANTGILSNLLAATLSGANPTWNQPKSTNSSIQLNGAHELQVFPFSDGGNNRSIILINLSRTSALPVTFSGPNSPTGTVAVGQLTSAKLTDTNESSGIVNITNSTLSNFQPASPYPLPPFSLTVFSWVTQ